MLHFLHIHTSCMPRQPDEIEAPKERFDGALMSAHHHEEDVWEDEEDEANYSFQTPVVAEFPRKEEIRRPQDVSPRPGSRRLSERFTERRKSSLRESDSTHLRHAHFSSAPSPIRRTTKLHAPSAVSDSWCGRACHTVLTVLGLSAPFDAGEYVYTVPSGTDSHSSTLWDHLMDEVLLTSNETTQELRWERVSNFMAMPAWIEQMMWIGTLVSLNAFLYMVTILPLRFGMAWIRWARNTWTWLRTNKKQFLTISNKCDILKGLLVWQTCYILSHVADASKMYHSVRGQDVLKLSVIFSVLEISDRLCSSFGQDVLDTLFSRYTLGRRVDGSHAYLRIAGYYSLCLAYMIFHTFVLLYQLVTLNVAINSYDNELLTLLLSNQFVEIKTTVFKRFEKETLFQLACADVVERFQLGVTLGTIGLRNLMELSGASAMGGTGALGPLPTSFEVYPYVNVLFRTLNPVLTVLISEVLVDWLKHAFIAKQNHIRPAVYGRFVDVLCRDILPPQSSVAMDGYTQRQSSFVDQSPLAIRRLGLAVLPLVCVLIRMASQVVYMFLPKERTSFEYAIQTTAVFFGTLAVWLSLVVFKLLLGSYLVSYAKQRYASWHEREKEEQRNAKGRPPIGEMPITMAHNAQIPEMVDKREDNAASVGLYGQQSPSIRASGKKQDMSLLDVQRFSFAGNRLW